MNFSEFSETLNAGAPPGGLHPLVRALWLDRQGDWEGAHSVAQNDASPAGSLIHGYLHRKEGDPTNAAYWYARAEEQMPTISLEAEWELLVRRFLGS